VRLVYDLVYTPEETRLLADAPRRPAARRSGAGDAGRAGGRTVPALDRADAPIEVMWEAARQWTVVTGTILAGHQVASKPSAHYPQGTIEMQEPFFRERGLDLTGFFRGTLNISIAPRQFHLQRATHFFHRSNGHEHHPPENFSFCRCRVTVAGRTVDGWVYYPHPED
jgi:hypothetical protein